MTRLLSLVLVLLIFGGLTISDRARAHALQPGYASIEQIGAASWQIFWRKPDVAGKPMAIDLQLPATCTPSSGPPVMRREGAWEAFWTASCVGGLLGKSLTISGLERTQTDVLVRFSPLGQASRSLRLTADRPDAVLPVEPEGWQVFEAYTWLGFEHILEGWDHLLFLFALLVLIRDFWRLVGAVTAFTVAHSLTLAASTLGWLTLPAAPVEAVIALSIVFLASEIAASRQGSRRLSQTAPWLVTFAFGLLHGLGFAGALKDIGLPQADIPLALLAFNIGVEAGQLAFVIAAAVIFQLLSTLLPDRRSILNMRPVSLVLAYVIGGWSSYWLIERIVSFA
ncbi:MAG: HupE/UreJ family protein [Pseudomonadota bacterium]